MIDLLRTLKARHFNVTRTRLLVALLGQGFFERDDHRGLLRGLGSGELAGPPTVGIVIGGRRVDLVAHGEPPLRSALDSVRSRRRKRPENGAGASAQSRSR